MSPTTRMLAHAVRTPEGRIEIAAYMAPENAAALLALSRARRAFIVAQREHIANVRGYQDAPDVGAWRDVCQTARALSLASVALEDAQRACGITGVEVF